MNIKAPDTKDYDVALKRLRLCEKRLRELGMFVQERNQEIFQLQDQVTGSDLDLHKAYQAGDEIKIEELESELEVLSKQIQRKEKIIASRDESIHAEHQRQVMLAEVTARNEWQQWLLKYEDVCVEAALAAAAALLKQAYQANNLANRGASGDYVFSGADVTAWTRYFGRCIASRLNDYECELPESPVQMSAPVSTLIPQDTRKRFQESPKKHKALHPATDAQFNEELLAS